MVLGGTKKVGAGNKGIRCGEYRVHPICPGIARLMRNATDKEDNEQEMGAYCRIIACMSIFRATLPYFSESDRNDADRCDVPGVYMSAGPRKRVRKGVRTVKRVSSLQKLRHFRVTSCSSSLSLSNELLVVHVCWHSRVVFDTKAPATRSAQLHGARHGSSSLQALTERRS